MHGCARLKYNWPVVRPLRGGNLATSSSFRFPPAIPLAFVPVHGLFFAVSDACGSQAGTAYSYTVLDGPRKSLRNSATPVVSDLVAGRVRYVPHSTQVTT